MLSSSFLSVPVSGSKRRPVNFNRELDRNQFFISLVEICKDINSRNHEGWTLRTLPGITMQRLLGSGRVIPQVEKQCPLVIKYWHVPGAIVDQLFAYVIG